MKGAVISSEFYFGTERLAKIEEVENDAREKLDSRQQQNGREKKYV